MHIEALTLLLDSHGMHRLHSEIHVHWIFWFTLNLLRFSVHLIFLDSMHRLNPHWIFWDSVYIEYSKIQCLLVSKWRVLIFTRLEKVQHYGTKVLTLLDQGSDTMGQVPTLWDQDSDSMARRFWLYFRHYWTKVPTLWDQFWHWGQRFRHYGAKVPTLWD